MYSFSEVSALFSTKYGDKVQEIIPEHTIILDGMPFDERAKIGKDFQVPVHLTRSAGVTYNSGAGSYSLNSAISPKYLTATVGGSVIWVTEQITEEAISRAKGGEKQFLSETKTIVSNLFQSMGFRCELEAMWGQTPLAASSQVAATGTTCTYTVSAAEWAPGIFLGSEQSLFDIFETTASASPVNAGAALTLTGVDDVNRVLTFTCASGDAAALEALTTSFLYFRGVKTGAATFIEAEGIASILGKTTGSIHGIPVDQYSLWKGRQYAVGGTALTFNKIQKSVVRAINAGLDQKVRVVLSTNTWTDVMNEQAALRMYDKSYKETEYANGSTGVILNGRNGQLEILSHPCMKEGYGFVLRSDSWKRVGSAEPHFPEFVEDKGFYKVPATNYYNIELTKDFVPMCTAPGNNVLITGITNSA